MGGWHSHCPASFYSLKDRFFFIQFTSMNICAMQNNITFNGGSLGSCIDEERSQLRYVMWIAEFSESSNLWTQMALLVMPGACLSECWFTYCEHMVCARVLRRRVHESARPSKCRKQTTATYKIWYLFICDEGVRNSNIHPLRSYILYRHTWLFVVTSLSFLFPLTSDQARLPAEFKHIIKQRKRN